MAGSNRDEKGSFQTDISQDVIDAALKSVDRHVQPQPPDLEEEEEEAFPENMTTMEVEIPEGGITMEVEVPAEGAAEPESGGGLRAELHRSHRELSEMRRDARRRRASCCAAGPPRAGGGAPAARVQPVAAAARRWSASRTATSAALRAAADLENYRKRAQKEKEEVQKFGAERLLKDFLPVMDNLDRALEAAQKSADFESLRRAWR